MFSSNYYDQFGFQNIYCLDMFKKTLLTFAIICLVFSQTFACKKKVKGAWKKVKSKGSECAGCLKRPNRKPLLSPSPSVVSSSGSYHSAYGDPNPWDPFASFKGTKTLFFKKCCCISKLLKSISRFYPRQQRHKPLSFPLSSYENTKRSKISRDK